MGGVTMKIFVARQPIFNRQKQVVAYELLFRSGHLEVYDAADDDAATVSVISGAFLLLGMDKATHSKRAFINFTRNLLKKDLVTQLPRQSVVIEILENIEPDAEIVEICTRLKRLGYVIALDDFIFSEKFQKLLELIDIIKVDFLVTTGQERSNIISLVNNPRIKFLAEKVETIADFEQAASLGYSYFQGYFFSKPEILSEEDVPSYKAQYARVLHEIHRPDMDYARMEEIIKHDVAFSYKLLKYVNSAYFGFRQEVDSVRHALVLLGKRQVEQWISLLILKELGKESPEEIMVLSVMRAKFGELLVQKMNLRELSSDVFIMGMFSLLDCLLHRPMQVILKELPISTDIKQALLGSDSLLGNIYCLILSYEKGQWNQFAHCAAKCNVAEVDVPDIYLQSLQWVEEFFEQTRN
jgi:EAL and modified HD-GYP domain-containing signal transduction protein